MPQIGPCQKFTTVFVVFQPNFRETANVPMLYLMTVYHENPNNRGML